MTVTFVSENASFSPDIPEFEISVCAAGGEEVSVGMEVNGSEAGLVPRQRSYQLCGLQIPDLESS